MKNSTLERKKKAVHLQDRDYLVLRWLLEMKFSDVDSIWTKFFRSPKTTVYKRLRILSSFGLIRSMSILDKQSIRLFTITHFGYSKLQKYFEGTRLVPPQTQIPIYTVDHDLKVLRSRVHLEKMGIIDSWVSERVIKSEGFQCNGFRERDFIPDGIFKDLKNKSWAFELEATQKSKKRIQRKIHHFVKTMIQPNPKFESCLFVCTNQFIEKAIRSSIGPFEEYFQTLLFDQIQNGEFDL